MKAMKNIFFSLRKPFLAVLCLACCMLLFTGCDEHEPLDSNIYPGFVLCDDHQVMSLEAYQAQCDEPHAVAAVGVIFAKSSNDHPMLAVMLFENGGVQFTNSLGLNCGTSCAIDAYDGYVNTVSMRNTYQEVKSKYTEYDDEGVAHTYEDVTTYFSPLGQWVFSSHKFGQSDYIPSYAECKLLQSNLAAVNATIRALGGTEISIDPKGGSCWYWTSTEDGDDSGNRAWLCSMATGGFQQTPKNEYHRSRAIVALNY